MSEELLLKGDRGYSILFHSPERDKKGWLAYYSVTFTAPDMNATIKVDNAPVGISPRELFEKMANEWQGWKGEKDWGSLEGEFDLSATSDSKGHITLVASIRSGYIPPCSKTVIELILEAGQLEMIKKHANEFFE